STRAARRAICSRQCGPSTRSHTPSLSSSTPFSPCGERSVGIALAVARSRIGTLACTCSFTLRTSYAPRPALPVRRAQHVLLDLAGRVAGHGLDLLKPRRALVARQALAAM